MNTHEIDKTIKDMRKEKDHLQENIEKISIEINKADEKISSRSIKLILLQIFLLIIGFFLPPFLGLSLIILIFNIISTKNRREKLNSDENNLTEQYQKLKNKHDDLDNEIQNLLQQKKEIISKLTFKTYVAGTSFNQKEIRKLIRFLEKNYKIFPNDIYTLSKRDLTEYGFDGIKIWQYDPIELNLSLVPEPNNEHDKNAIAVYYESDDIRIKLGYIPKKHIKKINKLEIENVKGFIKGGKYKLLKFVDYDDFKDKVYFDLINSSSNYTIDLDIKEHEKI